MLWDGRAFPRLAGHRARLAASAARLGWAAPQDLALAARGLAGEARRVRVTCDRTGALSVEDAPLPPPRPLWRVALHPVRLNSADPWLRLKSTRRALYDLARAELRPGIDEWLFANERGEMAEGTITSLFFDLGQGMRAVPLTTGCLPGVLRAELALPEAVLRLEDLPRARLWVGNALRGLMAAEWG
jgi:4-amino-4-deoxychorismate lyase